MTIEQAIEQAEKDFKEKFKDFEASRVCWECLEYCREHGLKLQTLEEYEEQKGFNIQEPIKRELVRLEEQRGI